MDANTNLTGRAGQWSAKHPWTAIGIWILFIVTALAIGSAVGTHQLSQSDQSVGSSARAEKTITKAFSQHAGEQILFHSPTSTVAGDTAYRAAIRDTVARVQQTGAALDLTSPLDPGHTNQISRDGHSALVSFDVIGSPDKADSRVVPILGAVNAAAAAHPAYHIEEAGDASINRSLNATAGHDFKRAERTAVPIALLVLLITFGAVVAALLPLGLALTAIAAAGGLLAPLSHISGVDSASSSVMLLIGLAVGVDYCLFYVKREREERAKGRSGPEALAIAASTSGRSVLISGITVLVALCGTFLTGSKIFVGIGEATILVVTAAVIGSLTVLPALLSLLGDRVNRGRIPLIGRHFHPEGQSRAWSWVVDRTLRRPALAVAAGAAALLVLAAPALFLHTATPGASDLPHNLPVLKTFDRIQSTFPDSGAPGVVVVSAHDVTTPRVAAGVQAMIHSALDSGQANQPITERVSADHTALMVLMPLAGNGENTASIRALSALRSQIIPRTIAAVPGVQVNVTGETAGTQDFNALMRSRGPAVFGFVLALAFGLLLFSFRSVVIAFKAVVLNLLSVFASYGVLVAVFQWGWGQSLLHFHSVHAVTSWLPLFLFVVLFSLSMDYHVFILSRIREAFDNGDSTERAIAHGVKSTAGVVTAAAMVMVTTFAVFATLSQVSMKQLGVGLAVAVLLDATIVRGVLLPAAMKLLGDWNWYLPRWLGGDGLDWRRPRGSRQIPGLVAGPVLDGVVHAHAAGPDAAPASLARSVRDGLG
jgi:RND superfamily putative drug exporter